MNADVLLWKTSLGTCACLCPYPTGSFPLFTFQSVCVCGGAPIPLPLCSNPSFPHSPISLDGCNMARLRFPSSAQSQRARYLLFPLLASSFLLGLVSGERLWKTGQAFYLPLWRDQALPLTDVSPFHILPLMGVEGSEITLLAFTNGKIETQAGMDAGPWAKAIQSYHRPVLRPSSPHSDPVGHRDHSSLSTGKGDPWW